jgi:multidrug efflux pump subunit AcrA (membrane-fusion protein)
MKRAAIVLLIIAAIGAGVGAYYYKRNGTEISVNTAPITRGDIIDSVGATGTLQAVTLCRSAARCRATFHGSARTSTRS